MEFNSASQLVKDVKDLFSLPDIYFQLNQMIHDQRFSLEDIGKVIGKDPALSARLLRVVNSALYGFQSRIDTIPRAIAVIGIDDLYILVVATCVVDRFNKIPTDLVDMTAFWMRSVHCALVCKLLAKNSAVLHAERLFLAGLLHDIGSLVLYQTMPEQALRVLLAIDHDRRLLTGFEQEIIGFTHVDVGRELLKLWMLPESLCEVVGCYREPETALVHKLDAHILNLASRLVEDSEIGKAAEDALLEVNDQSLAIVRLSREQIVLIMEQAAADFFEVFEMLAPNKKFDQGIATPN
jgi:HD-like signal output (HDOD) protein